MHEFNINSSETRSFSNEEMLLDINASKLKSLGSEYFPSIKAKQSSYELFIKRITEHFSYNPPPEISEFFIAPDEVKYFWLSNHPLVISLENYFVPFNKRNLKSYSEKEEIRRFFVKWANETLPKEKSFFASTVKGLIERNNSIDDVLKNLLLATIISFDEKSNAEEKFLNQYDLVNNAILNSSLPEELKNEYLYYENLFKAVHYINRKQTNEAGHYLQTACGFKQNGINASYYQLLLLDKGQESERITELIKSIAEFDINRLNYANSVNHKKLFDFFLRNSVSYNFFKEKGFGDLVINIKSVFESLGANGRSSFKFIEISADKLRSLPIKSYFTDTLTAELNYIDNFVKEYEQEKIIYIRLIDSYVVEKYFHFINKVKLQIKETEGKRITEEMTSMQKRVQLQNEEINYLQEDAEKWKTKASEQVKEIIKQNEARYASVISQVENILSKIDNNQEFDPYVSFNNSLIYNFIISMIVFIIGGFIDGLSDGNDLKASGLILSVFTGGLKWSAIVFIVGLVIAVIGMVAKMIEKSNEKQKLIRKISQLKSETERETEKIKKENEQKIKEYENSSKNKIEKAREQIEVLQKEKASRELVLKGEVEKKVAKIYETIDAVLI